MHRANLWRELCGVNWSRSTHRAIRLPANLRATELVRQNRYGQHENIRANAQSWMLSTPVAKPRVLDTVVHHQLARRSDRHDPPATSRQLGADPATDESSMARRANPVRPIRILSTEVSRRAREIRVRGSAVNWATRVRRSIHRARPLFLDARVPCAISHETSSSSRFTPPRPRAAHHHDGHGTSAGHRHA